MTDYKDMLTGTLNSLKGKAKDLAESDSVARLRDRVRQAAETSGVRGVYDQGASRAKSYGRIAKLSLEINGQHQELERVYAEIGKLYYSQERENPQGLFAPLFAQAGELTETILARRAEIDALKAELDDAAAPAYEGVQGDADSDIDAFESVVSATEEDGAPR